MHPMNKTLVFLFVAMSFVLYGCAEEPRQPTHRDLDEIVKIF